jgi:hypothetical protein
MIQAKWPTGFKCYGSAESSHRQQRSQALQTRWRTPGPDVQLGCSAWPAAQGSVDSRTARRVMICTSCALRIRTRSLGTFVANWRRTGYDMTGFFSAQELVFDITLCGDYGASPPFLPPHTHHLTVHRSLRTQPATRRGLCYEDYVLGSGANYDTAYFEVRRARVRHDVEHRHLGQRRGVGARGAGGVGARPARHRRDCR